MQNAPFEPKHFTKIIFYKCINWLKIKIEPLDDNNEKMRKTTSFKCVHKHDFSHINSLISCLSSACLSLFPVKILKKLPKLERSELITSLSSLFPMNRKNNKNSVQIKITYTN